MFAEAVSENYKNDEVDKNPEPDEPEEDSLSDDADGDEFPAPKIEEQQSSSEEVEPEVCSVAKGSQWSSRLIV